MCADWLNITKKKKNNYTQNTQNSRKQFVLQYVVSEVYPWAKWMLSRQKEKYNLNSLKNGPAYHNKSLCLTNRWQKRWIKLNLKFSFES